MQLDVTSHLFRPGVLSSFETEIGQLSLIPSETSGIFKIVVNGEEVFDRKSYGGFPEIKELKQKSVI